MATNMYLSWKDVVGQVSGLSVQSRDMDAANHDGLKTEFNTLRGALNGFSIGNPQLYQIVAERTVLSNGKAADMESRRELKLLLTYEDAVTGQQYHSELPCPDIKDATLWSSADPEQPDYASAEWLALKAAWETTIVSPDNNAVLLTKGQIVGRNL